MNVEEIRETVAFAVLAILVGTWIGYFFANRNAQHSAIQQDCAHYDTKTGEFKWGTQ